MITDLRPLFHTADSYPQLLLLARRGFLKTYSRIRYTKTIVKRTKTVVWVSVVLSLVAGASTLLITAQPAGYSSRAFHSMLFFSITNIVVQFGAALLFAWGLKGFKRQLRVAYGLICGGVLMLGAAHLQLPFVAYFDAGQQSFYVNSGLIIVPYLAPTVLVFFGVKRFAKLFDIKNIWMSFWFTLGLATLCSALLAGLAAVLRPEGGTQFIGNVGVTTWTTVFLLQSSVILVTVYRQSGPIYHSAIRWLAIARWVSTLSGAAYVVTLLLPANTTLFIEYGGILLPSVIASFFFLRSGYYFKLINEETNAPIPVKTVTIIDLITYLASQASNPAQIDSTLDSLRTITAGLGTNGLQSQLMPAQDATLRRVYADIEKYLVEREPIRQFTTEQLHLKITKNFGITNEQLAKLTDLSQPLIGSTQANASINPQPSAPITKNLQIS
jgi:hypothetical protein